MDTMNLRAQYKKNDNSFAVAFQIDVNSWL